MRKTKIICTLGPATDESVIRGLCLNGMNVARFNFSHGDQQYHKELLEILKKVTKQEKVNIGRLMDTRGPEIRIGKFSEESVSLIKGQTFTLTNKDILGDLNKVAVTYANLHRDISIGNTLLLDDGLVGLEVKSIEKGDIITEVLNDGVIGNNKGVNVPGVTISLEYLNDKDKSDLKFAVENDFDIIAASFVRRAEDIKYLKKYLESIGGKDLKVIAKIENREGVDNIEEIVRLADGIMIARGDMGVEIPMEKLPGLQKKLIKNCYSATKPAVTATQMLDSMIRNPRPTRAEVTDVANAIYDGTSAVMLSGETSIGLYPVETLKIMSRIIEETECNIDYIKQFHDAHVRISSNVTNAISHSTCSTAHTLQAAAIITVTKSGHTARNVSKYRPACPIFAITINDKVCRQLSLSWGVIPLLTVERFSTDEIFTGGKEEACKTEILKDGDLVVLTGGVPVGLSGTTNTLRVEVIGDLLLQGKGENNFSVTGNVCVINSSTTLKQDFNVNDILVIDKSTPKILSLIKNASALITSENSEDSQAAIVAKALEIPTITEAYNALNILKSGTMVRIQAKEGKVFSATGEN